MGKRQPKRARKKRLKSPGGKALEGLLLDPNLVPTPAMRAHEEKIRARLSGAPSDARRVINLLGGGILSAFAEDLPPITAEIDGEDRTLDADEVRALGNRMMARGAADYVIDKVPKLLDDVGRKSRGG